MSTGYSENSSLARVQAIADYQFGSLAGTGLFPEGCEFLLSTTGRIRQILYGGVRLATIRASDGRLTLGMEGARRSMRSSLRPVTGRLSGTMSRNLWRRERTRLQSTWSQLTRRSARGTTCWWSRAAIGSLPAALRSFRARRCLHLIMVQR